MRTTTASTRCGGSPLTVFHDGACPVCATEVGLLARRAPVGTLALVDIAGPGFDAAAHGFDPRALDAALHAVRADGTVLRGMSALRAVYAAAGLGALVAPTGWPLLRPLFDALYRAFARRRHGVGAALRRIARWRLGSGR